MSTIKYGLILLLSGGLALSAAAQTDNSIALDIDGPITAALASPEARDAVETEYLNVIAANPEWPEFYRAVRILAVVGTTKSVAPLAALLQQEDKSHLALWILESMPFPEVDAALLEAVKTAPRKSRLGIMSAMAVRKDRNAVPVLAALLTADDRQQLEYVTMAMGKIGGDEAARVLESLLKAGDETVESAAAEALLVLSEGLAAEGRGEDASKYYLEFLNADQPEHIRSGAFMGLLRAVPAQASEAVMQAIKSDDVLLRTTAIAAVSSLPGENVAARFTSEMGSLAPEIQVSLLESLSLRKEMIDPAFLFGLLADPREEMRIAAMKAIAAHGDSTAIGPIVGVFARSPGREEKQSAVETLRRLKGDTIDAELTALLGSLPPEQRPDVIEALVQRTAQSSVDALLAQTAEESVRPAAFRALGLLAGPERLDALLNALLTFTGDAGRDEAEGAVIALVRKSGIAAGEVTVSKAVYGNLPGGDFADVTAKVQQKFSEGALTVPVTNAEFGDPASGKPKTLEVEFSINGKAGKTSVSEGATLDILSQGIPPEIMAKVAAPLTGTASNEGRASIFRILSRVGGQDAYTLVKGYVNNEVPEVRDAAVRALAAWPDQAAVPDLIALFTTGSDPAHRGLALRGVVRLLKLGTLPQQESADHYGTLLKGAAGADERKLVLSGVAELGIVEAVALVHPLLADEAVREEAALALDKIKSRLGEEAFNNALSALNPAPASNAPVVDEAFIPIFNGTDLQGWSGDPALWRVEEGAIVGETKAEPALEYNTFLTWEGDEPGDFDIKFQYKLESEWANSGIQVRSERFDTYRVRGYQPDISKEDWITGICYEEGGRGILARRGQKVVLGAEGPTETTQFGDENALKDYIHPDDWNEYEVHLRGNQFYTRINGHKMHEVTDNSPQARRKGVIAFQLHAGPPMKIRIKDIMIKRVAASE